MEIMEIIDMMEETIDKATPVPLTGKIIIDKENLLDYIQEMRLVYPDEVKEAKWIKEERERILTEAENKAESMRKSTEEKIIQLIDEHEITKQAYEQANTMINNAQAQSMDIKADCDQYAVDILSDVEKRLNLLLNKVHEDLVVFQK